MRTVLALTLTLAVVPLVSSSQKAHAADRAIAHQPSYIPHASSELTIALRSLDIAQRHPTASRLSETAAMLHRASFAVCRPTARHFLQKALQELDRFCYDGDRHHLQTAALLTHRALEVERAFHAARRPLSSGTLHHDRHPIRQRTPQHFGFYNPAGRAPHAGYVPRGFSQQTSRFALQAFSPWAH